MKRAFIALGWGVVSAPEFDVGTDLFLLARDNRLFDLGLLIGAQVKTGDSWFTAPARDASGSIIGWWFRDSNREHIDYWLTHTLPHLVVLHDPPSDTSYWVHVTPESVVSTGRGAKVLVPRENKIDVHHRDDLLAVAATVRPPSMWEGSAWTGAGNVAPTDLLRHALLVPRLVAPHRNGGFSRAIGAEQAVALLVEARQEEIDKFARRHAQVPTLTEAVHSADWTWRFVGALSTRVTTEAVDQLLPLVEDAPNPPARAASAVVAASALLEQARPGEALDLIRSTLDRDDNTPVDHAWLTVQHARGCLEIGRMEDARSDAVQVQQVRLSHAGDVTATAIAGTAAQLLFTASGWGSGDVQEAITGQDTTAVWWRFQRVAAGSNAVVEREFNTWARRSAVVFAAEDTANNRLFTAALLASHLGDHSAWRALDSLNARQALLRVGRASEPELARELLATLHRNGDDTALDLAVRRLVTDGPAAAVTAAAAEIDLAQWTHTTSRTSLTLLRRGGDVLDETTAAGAVEWLLATLVDPRAFQTRTRPTFTVDQRLIDTLAGVVPAAPPSDRLAVAEFVLALPAQHDQLTATSWARVTRALPASTWTTDLASRTAKVAGTHHDALRFALLAVAVPTDEGARQQLVAEIRDKSLDALTAIGDVSALPDDVVEELIGVVESGITRQISEARQCAYGFGAHDVGAILAVLNLTHPDVARWKPIYALLEESGVSGDHKRETCDVLARGVDRLPADVRARLAEIASSMIAHPAALADRLIGRPDALGPAAALATSLSSDVKATQTLLTMLLSGDVDHRVWATRLALHLAPPAAAGVLSSLAQDTEPSVRAAAASCLARLVADGSEDMLAIATLRRGIQDPGTLVPKSIAKTVASRPRSTMVTSDLLRHMASHRSAFVRATVTDCPPSR